MNPQKKPTVNSYYEYKKTFFPNDVATKPTKEVYFTFNAERFSQDIKNSLRERK